VETELDSHHGGKFKMMLYVNTVEYAEHIALVKGDITKGGPVLVRMHAVNLFDDLLAVRGGRDDVLTRSMEAVEKEGRGVIVLIRESRGTYVSDLLMRKQPEPESTPRRLKEYGVGAQILLDLGVRDMILLTNSVSRKIVGLEGYGLRVVDTRMVGSRYKS
jgi:3,4-dihydroxy 2-butanone 4-phosphate synthase/GTP cyclohydrolase II